MLRGVNRQIIEVNDMQSPYFERAIFFVRPDCGEASEHRLHEQAVDWLADVSPTPVRMRRRKRRLSRRALWLFFWLAVAAAATLGVLYIAR